MNSVKTGIGTMNISGREYPIEGWHELARKNAVENYRRKFGVEPESVDVAVAWQREEAECIVRACEGAEAV